MIERLVVVINQTSFGQQITPFHLHCVIKVLSYRRTLHLSHWYLGTTLFKFAK